MSKVSVGELAIRLTASATEFDRVIGGAEKRMSQFATNAVAPLNMIRGMGNSISDAISRPFGTLLTDMTRFTAMIPGLGAASAAMAHPIQAAESAFHRLDKLGDQAERLGLGTQFLRGLQIAADDEIGALEPTMLKLAQFAGKLNSGSTDLLTAGGKSARKTAEEYGLDVEAWKAANPEERFRLFAQGAQKAAETGTEFAYAMALGGKGAGALMGTLKGNNWDDWIDKVKANNVATERAVALAQQWDQLQKQIMLKTEGAQESMLSSGGLMSLGMGQMATGGGFFPGLSDILQGGENYVREAFGGDPRNSEMPADHAAKLYHAAHEQMKKSLGGILARGSVEDYGNVKPLEDMMNELNWLAEFSNKQGFHSVGTASKIMEMMGSAKKMMPKGKGGGADPDEAAATKQLETALDPLANMTDINAIHALNESMRSPAEKAEDELYRLKELRSQGLGAETYERALSKLEKGLDKPVHAAAREADTALAGSQEWAKAFNRLSEGTPADDEQLEEMKRQTTVQHDVRDEIRKLQELRPKTLNVPP